MRKVWVYKPKNRKGYFVGWYQAGKRRSKALPTKALAEHYKAMKYVQLNSDVFGDGADVGWNELKSEYHQQKKLLGLTQSAIYEAMLTLRHFERIIKPRTSRRLTQALAERFILARADEIKKTTLRKEVQNLNAFFHWAATKKYTTQIKLTRPKVPEPIIRTLNPNQVRMLLAAAKTEGPVYIRVLLALVVGLRKGDIEALKRSDFDFQRRHVVARARKTGKSLTWPIPQLVIPELQRYFETLNGEQRLFTDYFTSKKWNRTRTKAGLPKLKFHDLRKTYASSLIQAGVSTSIVQTLLQHSTPNLTHSLYVNVDPVLRQAVDKLPVDEWLD